MTSEPIIPAIAARAKTMAASNPDFIATAYTPLACHGEPLAGLPKGRSNPLVKGGVNAPPESASAPGGQRSLGREFTRSDRGQVVGIFPEKEIFYGPSAGQEELRDLVTRFWTNAYHLKGKPGIPAPGLDRRNVAIFSGATEGLAIVVHLVAFQQNVGLMPLYYIGK